MRIVGIDPGKTGAIALFVEGYPTTVMDMPLGVHGVDGTAVFRQLKLWEADEAFIELTHAMPKNGSKAAYSQGDSNGALRTAVGIAQLPLTWVRPQEWQRAAGLTGGGFTDIERKRQARMRAIELMPGMSDWLNRAKDHNRAEALLIGRYGVATSIMAVLANG
jgi:crossover junction endodeoxyribonuclease RuvC